MIGSMLFVGGFSAYELFFKPGNIPKPDQYKKR